MMKIIQWSFVLYFLLQSCAEIEDVKPVTKFAQLSESYKVYLVNDFEENIPSIDWVVESLDEWKSKTTFKYQLFLTDETTLDVQNMNNANTMLIKWKKFDVEQIVDGIFLSTGAITTRQDIFNSSLIEINSRALLTRSSFKQVLMHELGHAFGIQHTDNYSEKSIMKASVINKLSSIHVECLDIKLYCQIWKCNNTCE